MKRIISMLIILAVICMWSCYSVEAENSITIESRLEITTFQSDFVFVKWFLRINLTEPDFKMKMLIPGDVLEDNVTFPVMVSLIDKIVDSQANETTFLIEGPLPLGTVSDDFPHDRYEAIYFVGCNFLPSDSFFALGANIPGPTDNYQGRWELRTDPEILNKTSHLPFELTKGYDHWFRMHVSIFHRSPFQEYVGMLAKQVPFCLQIFGGFLAVLMFLPIAYDFVSSRSLESRRIVLIERILIPICIAMIVFVPVYILALHEFEAPLIIPKVMQNLVNILYLYLGILVIGISFRVLLRGNDLETDKIQNKPTKEVRAHAIFE